MDFGNIIVREDGSYVIKGGMYHVPNEGEFAELWAQVDEYAKANPDNVTLEVEPEPEPKYEPTQEETEARIQKRLTNAVQHVLDSKAKELNYDSCLSVCSYIDTGVAKFDAEGVAFRKWRSAVWAKGYEILAEVQEGKREIPTEEELIADLPELVIVYENAEA